MKRTNLSVIALSDLLEALGFSLRDAWDVTAEGFSSVSYGDAPYTLVRNVKALDCIIAGNDYLKNPMDTDDLMRKYWALVADDFINLEA
jgi:hypothetical protein